MDWVTNAYTLSHYYLVNNEFTMARHHVAAARFVLEKHRSEFESTEFESPEDKEEAQEKLSQASAQIDRSWGRYCFVLLLKSHDKLIGFEKIIIM